YCELATQAKGADLLVWPESSIPGWLDDAPVKQWLTGLVRSTGKPNLVGAVARVPQGVVNGAVAIAPDGTAGSLYAKRHLVPFGEVVPFQSLLGRWVPILTELGGVRLGASVCYEVVFPDEVRDTVAAGAEVLVNLTNDGWYLDTAAPYQHLSMSALRAAENRRPLIRAANTGISAVFDAHGRLHESLGINQRGVLTATVVPGSGL